MRFINNKLPKFKILLVFKTNNNLSKFIIFFILSILLVNLCKLIYI